MKKKIESDEIDFMGVIVDIWNNKFKIAAITAIFIVLSISYYFVKKPPLNAKTEILPITIFENNLYSSYNNLVGPKTAHEDQENLNNINQENLNNIDKEYLLEFFIEELQTREIIKDSIKKYQLIDRKKFDNEDKYLEAVEKYALSLNLLRPINVDGSKRGETKLNWSIEFKVDNKNKWNEALKFIESKVNKNIQGYLTENFNKSLKNLKLINKFKLEDLDLKIINVKKDYEFKTHSRLAFLKEQALIARELGIESSIETINSTIQTQEFTNSANIIANSIESTNFYYLRGYNVIEKEIELIKTRADKSAFTKGLLDLQKKKRALLDNKSLERIEELFNSTPIVNDNNFKAASIIYKDTKYEASFNLIKSVLFTGIFGIVFGIFYVLISNAIQQRK